MVIKKLALFIPIFTLIFFIFLSPSLSYAQVNIISDATHAEYAEAYGLNQTIVFAGHPNNPQQIIDVCNRANICVIRGHAHWLYGSDMLENPSAAAATWSNALETIAENTTGQVFFMPWNEPMRLDVECGGRDLGDCANRIRVFINSLNTHGITLTSPAIDPYHPNSKAMISALGDIPYSVIAMNIYSPQMARNYRSVLESLGVRGAASMQVILTETGALDNTGDDTPNEAGTPVYREKILCNMYCTEINGQTTVDFWKNQGIHYALFSHGPDGIRWNLWQADCVIDALKGICRCEDCKDDTIEDNLSIKDLVEQMFMRDGGREPTLDLERGSEVKVGRNWAFGGETQEICNRRPIILGDAPDPGRPWLLDLLAMLIRTLKEALAIDLFRYKLEGRDNPFASILNLLGLGSQDLVPSHREGKHPGEDAYVKRILETEELDLPGMTAQICLPPRDIGYVLDVISSESPENILVKIGNKVSIHEEIWNTLTVYSEMRHWLVGTAYSDYLEHIDMSDKEGQHEMAYRSLTNLFRAGTISRYLPGEEHRIEEDYFANMRIKDLLASKQPTHPESPLYDPNNIEKAIAIIDKPLNRACSGYGNPLLTEFVFEEFTDDQRVDRKEAEFENCERPWEIHPSWMVCCDRNHVENVLNLEYEVVCKHLIEDNITQWCDENVNEPAAQYGDFLWDKYNRGKLASDSGISEGDWPIYMEQCFVVPESQCQNNISYNGLFIDLTKKERAHIFPPATYDQPDQPNSFLTKHDGKCLHCQIVKLLIPEGLGALDACRHMTSMLIPGEMYKEIINEERPDRKIFDCDVGVLPYTDGEEGHKDNADYKNWTKTFSHDSRRGGNFFETIFEVFNPGRVGDENGDPIEHHQVTLRTESLMHLYIPHYEKLQMCTDFYFGLLAGELAEILERELEEKNEHKLPARDLLARARTSRFWDEDAGPMSATINDDRINSILGYIPQDEDIYEVGAGTQAGVKASKAFLVPGELQDQWLGTTQATGDRPFPASFPTWDLDPRDLIDIGEQPNLASTIAELRKIAENYGIPHELLLAKFWIEGGYLWDGGENWCPVDDRACRRSVDSNLYWIGLRHYYPDGSLIVSYAGAEGIAQIVPRWHGTQYGGTYNVERGRTDWFYNASYGAEYLKRLYGQSDNNWAEAIRRYHGPGERATVIDHHIKPILRNPPINPETGQPAWNAWSDARIRSVLGE